MVESRFRVPSKAKEILFRVNIVFLLYVIYYIRSLFCSSCSATMCFKVLVNSQIAFLLFSRLQYNSISFLRSADKVSDHLFEVELVLNK